MYANVITTRYKSPEDLETAVGKLEELGAEVQNASGFEALYFVRTGETKTTHTAVFDTQQTADNIREKMFPRFMEVVGEHLADEPTVEPGEVLIHS